MSPPTAKRQTVRMTRFVRIRQFLHRRAQWSRPTVSVRPRFVGYDDPACRPRSGRQKRPADLYMIGSSARRAQWSRPTVSLRPRFVGHDDPACRPRSGRQERPADLYTIGSSARRAEVVSAAVRDEGALRMRHTPCGCAPYGELLLISKLRS